MENFARLWFILFKCRRALRMKNDKCLYRQKLYLFLKNQTWELREALNSIAFNCYCFVDNSECSTIHRIPQPLSPVHPTILSRHKNQCNCSLIISVTLEGAHAQSQWLRIHVQSLNLKVPTRVIEQSSSKTEYHFSSTAHAYPRLPHELIKL